MKKKFKYLIVIAFLLIRSAGYAQVSISSNVARANPDFVGWDGTGLNSKSLDIKNLFTTQPINLWTSGNQQMTITSIGNVGIGNGFTNPVSLLHINGKLFTDTTNGTGEM